jgi:hypothetical protein
LAVMVQTEGACQVCGGQLGELGATVFWSGL